MEQSKVAKLQDMNATQKRRPQPKREKGKIRMCQAEKKSGHVLELFKILFCVSNMSIKGCEAILNMSSA